METFAGRFALIRPLGEGGMGNVYLARDLESGETVALKRLSRPLHDRLRSAEPEILRAEFEAVTRVGHPVIVTMHELGVAADGTPFLSMEYVPGVPSDQAGLAGDWPALLFVAAEMARGLEALHLAGVVHGDVKPSNLLVLRDPNPEAPPAGVRLLDFGLAGLLERERPGHTGTPGFQAPEVVAGTAPSASSDLYGAGATLFMLATGQPPFPGEDAMSVLHRQREGPPAALPLEQAGAPPALVELILRLLASQPVERPATASELRRELERIHPAARRPLAERLETAMLVDRERELAVFESLLAGAPGTRRVLFLAGESGSGRTTLLHTFGARATLAGRLVVRRLGLAGELPGEGLRTLVRRLESELEADEVTEPAMAHDIEESERWITRAVHAIGRVAERRGEPVVLIDDADQMDETSRTGLRRLWLRQPAPPARWVMVCGPAALDPRSDERLLVDAGVAGMCEPGPMSRVAVTRLIATRLGGEPPATLAERLFERAGGHPGLTVALLREAARAGVLSVSDGVLTVDETRLDTLEPPGDYAATELARLAALPRAGREVMLALAVAGRALEPAELTQLAGDDAETEAARLLGLGLLSRGEDGRWSLTAPWAARRMLESEPAETVQAWHALALTLPALSWRERFEHLSGGGDVTAALVAAEQAFAALPDARLAVSAATLAEPHDAAAAAVWHERAARELVRLGRYEAALPHWRQAYQLEPAQPAAGARAVGWCVAALRSGHHRMAETVALETEAGVPPASAALLMANRACAVDYDGRASEAVPIAEQALALADGTGEAAAEAIACELRTNQLIRAGRVAEAGSWAERAVAAYRKSGVPVAETRSHLLLGGLARAGGRFEQAEEHYRAAIALARAGRLRVSLEEHLMSVAVVMVDSGRWLEAGQCVDEALRLAIEDGRGTGAALLMGMLAMSHAMVGRPRAAERAARRALRIQSRHAPRLLPSGWRAIAAAARLRGRLETATRAARRALALAPGERLERVWARMELAVVLLRQHRWTAAESMLARLIEDAGGVNGTGTAIAQARRAIAAVWRDDTVTASTHLAVAERWLERHPLSYARAAIAEARALLLLAEGRAKEGTDAAARSLETWAALPAPAERAGAALGFARQALRRGLARVPGLGWLGLAARTYERLGDLAGRAEALACENEWLRRMQPAPAAEPVDQGDLLRRVSELLRSLPDPRELTHRSMQLAVEQLRAERGVLLWMDRDTRVLTPVAEYGAVDAETREEAIGYSRKVTTRVAESGGTILVRDAGSDRRLLSDSVRNMRLRSILCVPMFLGGAVVGAVYLDDSRRSNTFGDDERRLLEGFAGLMAVAIDSSRGHERTERERSDLERENRDLLAQAAQRIRRTGLLGTSPEMQPVFDAIEKSARSDNTTVLIGGESGTGKEMVARTIHDLSRRREKPFVVVNCGAITETLLESELFGHVKGAFTGAIRDRRGAFELARGGTLFLDEIAEMPMAQQVALLSVLSNRQVTPVGGDHPVSVDVRIIAATNADLRQRVEEGRFREDLYYRLRVLDIELPPLRARKADVPALAQHFLEQICARDKRPVPRVLPQFVAVIMQSDWPGNVRELQNYVERVLARTDGHVLFPDPLPFDLQKGAAIPFIGPRRLPDAIAELERRMVREAVERHEGNQSGAARELDITEQALRYKLRKYNLPSARDNLRTRRNKRT